MGKRYDAADIEVLSGLEPVRRRPGMYTDTTRPNHLAHEVVDNSVDEALSGHCKKIDVTLYKDGSLEVSDDGRGMPVDIHPKEKIPGVELILTRLARRRKIQQGKLPVFRRTARRRRVGRQRLVEAPGSVDSPRRQGIQHELRRRQQAQQTRSSRHPSAKPIPARPSVSGRTRSISIHRSFPFLA